MICRDNGAAPASAQLARATTTSARPPRPRHSTRNPHKSVEFISHLKKRRGGGGRTTFRSRTPHLEGDCDVQTKLTSGHCGTVRFVFFPLLVR